MTSRGTLTFISGPSGSGKSLTANQIRERNLMLGQETVIYDDGYARTEQEIVELLDSGINVVVAFGGRVGPVSVINTGRGLV